MPPASTARVRSFRPARNPRISAPACAILTTHGHTRRSSLRPDRAIFRLRPSTRESERQRLSSLSSDGSVQRATELAVASFRTPFVTDPFAEINEIRLWEIRLSFHSRASFRPLYPHRPTTAELRRAFTVRQMWVSRELLPWSRKSPQAEASAWSHSSAKSRGSLGPPRSSSAPRRAPALRAAHRSRRA